MRILLIALILTYVSMDAQTSRDAAVLLTADVQTSPPEITIKWPQMTASTYLIYRKLKDESSFGTAISVLAGTAVQYKDTDLP